MSNNAWDIPPFPTKGDQTNRDTYAAVGFALSQWEWFEGHLAILYAGLVGSTPDEGFAAMRGYGTVVSFNARRKMVGEAANVHFIANPDPDLNQELKALLTCAEKLAVRRNEIAHGFVTGYVDDTDDVYPTHAGYELVPAYHATSKRRLDPKDLPLQVTSASYIYTSKEIDHFAKEFAKLVDPLARIISQIRARKQNK